MDVKITYKPIEEYIIYREYFDGDSIVYWSRYGDWSFEENEALICSYNTMQSLVSLFRMTFDKDIKFKEV